MNRSVRASFLPVMRAAQLVLVLLAPALAGDKTTTAQLAFATTDDADFERKPKPRAGEWLDRFKEPGQSFERYVKDRPVRARGERRAFALLPVGPFDETQRKLITGTAAFSRLWFALEVRVLPGKPLPKTGWQRLHFGATQYRTAYFLDNLLPDNLPKDAVCLFGVTMADLYPGEDWNFVFGQAHLRRRVAVCVSIRVPAQFVVERRDGHAGKRPPRRIADHSNGVLLAHQR